MLTPDELLAAAERVRAAANEYERDAALRAAHPRAKHPEEAARYAARARRRRLAAMAATLTEDEPDAA